MLPSSTEVLTEDRTTVVEVCVGKATKQEERTDQKHSRALKTNKQNLCLFLHLILWGPNCEDSPLNSPTNSVTGKKL